MANFADLVLGFRTEGHAQTQKALKDTTKSGGEAQRAADGMGRELTRSGVRASAAAPKVRKFQSATDLARKAALSATNTLKGLADPDPNQPVFFVDRIVVHPCLGWDAACAGGPDALARAIKCQAVIAALNRVILYAPL